METRATRATKRRSDGATKGRKARSPRLSLRRLVASSLRRSLMSSSQVPRSLHIDRRKVVVEVQKDRQRHSRFGGGEDDDEDGEDLPVQPQRDARAAAVRETV